MTLPCGSAMSAAAAAVGRMKAWADGQRFGSDERGEEQFLTLGRKTGRGIIADIRYTEFDKDADVAVASTVPPDVRAESLAASQDLWRVRGNVPMSAEEHGYFPNEANDLGSRVQSLQIQTKQRLLANSKRPHKQPNTDDYCAQ